MGTPQRTPPSEPLRETLELLLARADDHQPSLPSGLDPASVQSAPRPERLPRRAEVPLLDRPDADPNALPEQRWGVISPEGDEGDRLLRAIAPLVEHRARQQDAEVKIYRVHPDMDAAQAVTWRERVYRDERVPAEERPRYLLVLGSPQQVSFELQHVLAQGAFVGRLHFATPEGTPDLASHGAYVDKVLAHEHSSEQAEAADVLLYTASDGSRATVQGHQLLMEPCRKMVEARWLPKQLARRLEVLLGEEAEELPSVAGTVRSGVLLSVSHGLGAPSGGWASAEQQRARQGALCLAPERELTADMVRQSPFLPGGMWFCVACFGAATPRKSAFHAWLSMMAKQKRFPGRPEAVLDNLPRPGEPPFLAALPQALLANPLGPLAFVGHSDLAWNFGFANPDNLAESRASRILSALEVLAKGSRVGVALDALMRSFRDVNDSLMSAYQERQEALEEERPDPIDPKRLGYLWMLRNDLRGYLLLGDPAVRLQLRRATK
ncbi:hypothetical protein D187_006939 [Cystobacter fuscus DSM 2262]|uniref:Uncharacterized protein n=1 Tax=Cystobacter fuscus (strain ATCC 25194 / DSM 2262 / NBRC 100088 / M29) TaxID=1242864 RepID=S9NYB0_CYSF2|nr:hypothetical protein [Cystobacter fuscus]EPX57185.1 hypothetical protein D187_006939 [Cystobacter fuscus DSM 2262]